MGTPVAGQHQAIYRRWRAQTFRDVIAQDAVIETLRNAVRLDRLAHGLLFVGPRGTGKTSTARIVAKAVNCGNAVEGEPDDSCERCVAIRDGRALDVVELDAASNNRVDDMRELLPRVYTAAADLKKKVFIIDEVQRIKEGWDVLLKTLEEPPPDVLFIFCTTDPSGIRPAVISRLQRFTFRPLPERHITGKLKRIADAEGRLITDDAIALIAQRAAGGMRDAESMLDQIISAGTERIDADTVRELLGLAEMETVDRFVAALAGAEPLAGITLIDDLERDGRDLLAFADQVVARTRERLIEALSGGAKNADSAGRLARAARRLASLDSNKGAAGGYRLQLELALLEGAVYSARAGASGTSTEPVARAVESAPPPPAAAEQPPAPPSRSPAPSEPTLAPAEPTAPSPEPTFAAPVAPTAPSPIAAASPERTPRVPTPARAPAAPAIEREAPATAAPVPPPTSSVDQSLQTLLDSWPSIVQAVARNPANRPLIAACRPVEVRDATVVLGFPESQAFLRDIAERKRAILEEGIGEVLGRVVAVKCVVTNVELVQPAAELGGRVSDGDDLVAQARRIFADDLIDVAEVE